MSEYAAFLDRKRLIAPVTGVTVPADALHPALKDFQRAATAWALRKGRAALWQDTGLGKTLEQLVWARHAAARTLILAPLAVARQTVLEGEKWDIPVAYARSQQQAAPAGITITNYEMLGHFDAAAFGAVVLDESSCLADFASVTRNTLIATFRDTPMRLCCTATPAPNDIAELANHAEFLGQMTRVEMLASFFVHDDAGWRLRGHAGPAFYRWLASWAMSMRRPSDLGYCDDGYDLPPLEIRPVILPTEYVPEGRLFAATLKGVTDRAAVRRQTLPERVRAAAALIAAESGEQWLAWVGLNDEGRQLAASVPGAVLVEGQQSPDQKADALLRFAAGETRVLVTKASIAGLGLNLQSCARQVFVGLGDSYQFYYQAIRRCWRFGQRRPVHAYIVVTEPEEAIYRNVLRKEREATTMGSELVSQVAEYERQELSAPAEHEDYRTGEASGRGWRLLLGDSAERLAELPAASVDLSVFSPPFADLYVYSASDRDLGNSRSPEQFWQHFGYVIRELLRLTRPGRNCCVHVADVPALLVKDGYIGLKDFPGDTIRAFVAGGWIYHGRISVDKNPQAQAIRTHSKSLLFTQLRKDSSWSRPALADYLLIFRKPGENVVPIRPELTNDEWIAWASPLWTGVRETHTLNVAEARGPEDDRHICPLQLDLIERCIRLWSNPGETVLDPFGGLGSTPFEAVLLGRRGLACELNPNYFRAAVRNLQRAEAQTHRATLFDAADVPA